VRILLTGASGFIGKALIVELLHKNFNVSIAVRHKISQLPGEVKQFVVGDFGAKPDFFVSLDKVDCVIHLAGKAHVIGKAKASTLSEFRKINTNLTINLAKQAESAGVRRFVFLSSIGVNGNQTSGSPFTEIDAPNPQGPYAHSKYEAEQGLLKLANNSCLEVVIIRPPLVYGKGAPGNFGRLIQWARAKVILPLPLGAVHNARSLIAIDNLVSFIITCTLHPKAANEVFLISDDNNFSTTQLLKNIAKAFDKKALLFPIPVNWMIFMAKLLGREADAVRLFSSLVVNSDKGRDLLGWSPSVSMDEQLNKITVNEKNI